MSGAFPSTPLPSAVQLGSQVPTLLDITQSGKRNVRQFGAQRWVLNLSFPGTLSRDQMMPIYAFVMKQKGRVGTFTFVSPELATPRGVATGTPLVNANQTGNSIVLKGWTTGVTGILKAGDVLKFASHAKVYMVTDDVNSDGGGLATVPIEPPVTQEVVTDEAVTVNDVPFTCMLSAENNEYSVSGPLLYTYSLSLLEVI